MRRLASVCCLLSACSQQPQQADATTGEGGNSSTRSSAGGSEGAPSSGDPTSGSTNPSTSGSAVDSSSAATNASSTSSTTIGDDEVCNGVVGLARPLPECSSEKPCTHVATEIGGTISSPSDPPLCDAPQWTEAPRQWTVGGTERYACVYTPPDALDAPRPLVVFLHPGGEGADTVIETSLLEKAVDVSLSDPEGPDGFVLAAVQGRNLHFPTSAPRDGRHHDFYHRDLGSPSSNPDVAALDALIDELMETGTVDANRIYIMGWSNGAFYGQLYAIARHLETTPAGNRVAAAAVYAAADPFDDIQRDPFSEAPHEGPSCKLDELPSSNVPILLTYRTCDFATPCGAGGDECFGSEPGFVTSDWLEAAATALPNLSGRLIGGVELGPLSDGPAAMCSPVAENCDDPPDPERPCFQNADGVSCVCLLNHLRWPDGEYAGGSGIDSEPGMLAFLRGNPLPR